MIRSIIASSLLASSVLAVVISAPTIVHADSYTDILRATGKPAGRSTPEAANNQTAVGCNFCFTCGGDWPVFAGSIRSVGDFPIERGPSCSGALINRNDGSPFLCCR